MDKSKEKEQFPPGYEKGATECKEDFTSPVNEVF